MSPQKGRRYSLSTEAAAAADRGSSTHLRFCAVARLVDGVRADPGLRSPCTQVSHSHRVQLVNLCYDQFDQLPFRVRAIARVFDRLSRHPDSLRTLAQAPGA